MLSALTILVALLPALAPAAVNDRFDIAIVTAAALVSFSVAAIAWSRGRVANDISALLRASAFAILALLNGLILAVGVFGLDHTLDSSLETAGQLPLYASVIGRSASAALLEAAGIAALSRRAPLIRPGVVVLGPALVVLTLLAVAAVFRDDLPAIASRSALDALRADPTQPLPPGSAPALVLLQGLIGILFLIAAWLAHRAFRRSGRAGDALLAAGLLIAAFSQAHSAMHPGSYSSVVTSGDLLRLAFYGVLLVGIVVDSRDDLNELRTATMEVRRLAQAEFAAATLEERARLAREIHDGLAQDLWYAKLKQSRLAQIGQLTGEGGQLSEEVGTAIDNALAEARHAIAAMRGGAETGPFLDLLQRQVEDFSDRFAMRAELTRSGREPDIGPRAQAELVRIVQEALTNIRKHADATVVRVSVDTDDALRITISDNGRGFRPEAVTGGFGLDSMRQRATIIGAELTITSAAQDGSRVQLVMPLNGVKETDGR